MHDENTTTLRSAADGVTGNPTNKLTKWLIIVIVALLAMMIVAGWLINDKRNDFTSVITAKETTIQLLKAEMHKRDSVTAEIMKQQKVLVAEYEKKLKKLPGVKIKYEKIKDSLRTLPPDEQLLFLTRRLAEAEKNGWQ